MDLSPGEPQLHTPPKEETAHLDQEREGTEVKEEAPELNPQSIATESPVEDFSVFTRKEKTLFVILASLAALFSPLSANIYYSALNTLAEDFHTTLTHINLTITTYLASKNGLKIHM